MRRGNGEGEEEEGTILPPLLPTLTGGMFIELISYNVRCRVRE